jgi:hypothetical protein
MPRRRHERSVSGVTPSSIAAAFVLNNSVVAMTDYVIDSAATNGEFYRPRPPVMRPPPDPSLMAFSDTGLGGRHARE